LNEASRKPAPQTATPEPPKLRGLAVNSTVQWAKKAYGDALVARAISKLAPDEQELFKRSIQSTVWYPLTAWERFLDSLYEEITAMTGEDTRTIDRRNFREGGGKLLQTIYRFLVSFLKPSTTLARMSGTFARVYNQGRAEIAENRPGYCVSRCVVPVAMRDHIARIFPEGMDYIIELAGAKVLSVGITRNEIVGDECIIACTARYEE
jgi:hypothetical protein